MALIDTFQLTHFYSGFGVPMNNMYHVLRANSGEQAQEINDAFANSILPTVRLFQSDNLVNTSLVCFNLDDEEDFHTQDLASAPGLRTVIDSPTFVSAGIRFPSLNRKIRSGHKRFAGLGEADYANGVLFGPVIGLLEDIGDDLLANWLASVDSHHVGNFIIIKRVCDEVDPVTGACLRYRLPESDVELKFYQPTSRLLNLDVTSQVSRKVF